MFLVVLTAKLVYLFTATFTNKNSVYVMNAYSDML